MYARALVLGSLCTALCSHWLGSLTRTSTATLLCPRACYAWACVLSVRPQAASLYKKWVEAAGATVVGTGMVFVSPLASYAGEGLAALHGTTLRTPCIVKPASATGLAFREASPLPDGTHVYKINPRAVQSPERKASAAAASCVSGRSKSRSPTRGASPRKSDRFADLRSRSVCAYVMGVHVPVTHALTQCRCCVVLPLLLLACFCRMDLGRHVLGVVSCAAAGSLPRVSRTCSSGMMRGS